MFRYLTGLDYEGSARRPVRSLRRGPLAAHHAVPPSPRRRDGALGRRSGALDSALKDSTGFANIKRTPYLPGMLSEAARRTKRLACLHPFASYTADVSPDLEIFHKIAQRIPGVAIEDRTQLLPAMRAVKSPAELALIERAVVATAAGFEACLRAIRPGMREKDVADLLIDRLSRARLRAGLRTHRGRGPQRHGPSLHATTAPSSPKAT